ncbi:MAG: ACT domain-containing protein [Candidatus Bipolaricaulota bacterium]|nr:ACT domain-containing protein [Candidatus Bipolaricaulota bacterium]
MREARLVQEIVIEDVDRVGVVADISRLLGDMGINLSAVSAAVDGESVRIHLITSSQSYARDALRDAGYTVRERDVIAMELPHHPGFLCRITEALARRNLTITELYATVPEDGDTGLVVFSCPNNLHALQLLRGH